MTGGFSCKETEKIWNGERSKKLPVEIQQRAFLRLRQLDASEIIDDLRIPPGNRLESLSGNLKGYWSIRINQQWRMVFHWENGRATEVKKNDQLIPLINFFAETLRETIDEWSVSQAEISRITGIPSPHLTDMKKSRRRCTPEYDLRLGRYFGTSPGFWLRLQLDYELMRAQRDKGELIRKEVQPCAA